MLKIRLRRTGAKFQPTYRVVVADSRAPRDGAFVAILGFYNPRSEPATIKVDEAALRENRPKPLQREHLQMIHAEVLRLEKTVQNFLDFARPPALERHTCDLCEVVAQTAELVRTRARQQQVDGALQARVVGGAHAVGMRALEGGARARHESHQHDGGAQHQPRADGRVHGHSSVKR